MLLCEKQIGDFALKRGQHSTIESWNFASEPGAKQYEGLSVEWSLLLDYTGKPMILMAPVHTKVMV